MHHIVRFVLAKADDILMLRKAAETLANGVVRWAARSAPRLAGAGETLMVGAARRVTWNALAVVAALGSLTAGLIRWLETAGSRRSK